MNTASSVAIIIILIITVIKEVQNTPRISKFLQQKQQKLCENLSITTDKLNELMQASN